MVMIVCITSNGPFSPRAIRSATSRVAGTIPGPDRKASGCFEISEMCACFVIAQ